MEAHTESVTHPAHEATGSLRFPVVAIGASAGGLEALESLFLGMPLKTGMAFVVLQHLSPDFESHMDELLARKTGIPIRRVTDGMEVEPNAIYLIPPRKEMIISGGRLLLTEKDPDRGLALPIDIFFRSLANDQGPRSIGVVLSGTGSDGSRGLRAIHEAGGYAISQSEDSARFDGMPRAAIATGVVDVVAAPKEIPALLLARAKRLDDGLVEPEVAADGSDEPLDGFERIFEVLRGAYGIDFAHYKSSTVTRRIERRLQLVQADDLEDYANRVVASPAELDALYHDLLIGVTQFFRDPEAYGELERHVIPSILEATGARDEIRVWVAGCATGEEAYSLAILLHERLLAAGRKPHLKIFATDVHKASLEAASLGVYADAAVADVSPARLERWFQKRPDGRVQVAKELRQLIVFAPQNVVADAPFTRLDLVSCRNLLIYLQPSAQKKVLSLFHFGLKTGGYLLLGPSESPGELGDEFDALDRRWKIYRKRRDVRLPAALRLPATLPIAPRRRALGAAWPTSLGDGNILCIYDRLLGQYMPSALLCDEHFNLMHCFGGAERYVRVPAGRPTSSLLELVTPGLKTPLSGALQQAVKEQKKVRWSGIPIYTDTGEARRGTIQVEPIVDERTHVTSYLVQLDTQETPAPSAEASHVDLGQLSSDRIQALETELRFTNESLQASIEELETSNEELQATNEELVASNEELQSTNEELHSVNEELHTVNAELQAKISELTEATADLDSLLEASEVGVLFLDLSLCIRKYTPKIVEAFHLLPQDVGRPIETFQHRLLHPSLVDDIRAVLTTGQALDKDVLAEGGRSFYLRVLPYRQGPRLAGVVLTLLDIGHLRKVEQSSRLLSAIIESSADAIVATDLSGLVTHWNRGATQMYGRTSDEMVGRPLNEIIPEPHRAELHAILASIAAGEPLDYAESVRRRKDGTVLHVSLQVSPIRGPRGEVVGVATIERDITQRKRVEEDVRKAVAQRERFLAVLSHELRNPLAAIVSAARVLQSTGETGPDLKGRALAVLQRQSTHMARLMDDLLDISRIRQGKLDLRSDLLDLLQAVEESLETVTAQIEERGCRLEVELTDQPLPMVGDPHRLRQLIVNLLTNAIRHTAAGRRIQVRLSRSDDRARITIQDEGVGIAPELRDRIFEPFTVQGATTRRNGGLGIGLWLVRSIAEAHNGTVSVLSEGVGRGAEFTVDLPLAQAVLPPRRASTSPGSVGGRIVLVEDQADLLELLEAILAGAGMNVRSAPTAERALELIDAERPDLALVDVGLPGMSGLELSRKLRARFGSDRLRLIAVTGYGQQADREAVYEAGFDQHLIKPVDLDSLIDVIRGELAILREQPS